MYRLMYNKRYMEKKVEGKSKEQQDDHEDYEQKGKKVQSEL